jgi:hypothetical protein
VFGQRIAIRQAHFLDQLLCLHSDSAKFQPMG